MVYLTYKGSIAFLGGCTDPPVPDCYYNLDSFFVFDGISLSRNRILHLSANSVFFYNELPIALKYTACRYYLFTKKDKYLQDNEIAVSGGSSFLYYNSAHKLAIRERVVQEYGQKKLIHLSATNIVTGKSRSQSLYIANKDFSKCDLGGLNAANGVKRAKYVLKLLGYK